MIKEYTCEECGSPREEMDDNGMHVLLPCKCRTNTKPKVTHARGINIGLDIDGTITEHPEFYSHLSQSWTAGDVYIVTYRPPDRETDAKELESFGIKFKEILYAKNEDSKAELCEQHDIKVLFDDDPQFLVHCRQPMLALLARNKHNFDYKNKQYLFTEYSGRLNLEDSEIYALREGLRNRANYPSSSAFWEVINRLASAYR